MDFSLSDDQRAIADMAGSLFADHCTDEHLIAQDRSGEPFDATLWRKVVETGLHALLLPEAADGSGLGMTEMLLVLEAQGSALGNVPLWRSQLAAAALLQFNSPLAGKLVPAVATGDVFATLSLDGIFASRGLSLRARRCNGKLVLSGTAPAVALGAQAQWALLTVEFEGLARLAVVELPAAGVSVEQGSLTNYECIADLRFEDFPLLQDTLLPEAALNWLEPRAIACVAALQVGVSAQQLRRTVEYVNERKQFGRAIGSFQAVQMKIADCFIQKEALRTSLWQLCYRFDAGLGVEHQAQATRFLACETGQFIGHAAQHVHGGVGVDMTHPMHRFLFWSRTLSLALGGPQAALARLGHCLADNDRLGWKYDLEENCAS